MSQQHSFITFIKNKHNFELTIFGLNVTASWRINFRQYFRMLVLSPTARLKIHINNKIPKTKIVFNNLLINSILKCILNLEINSTVFSFVMKELLKITNTLEIPKTVIITSLNVIYKLDPTNIISITNNTIIVKIKPSIGIFNCEITSGGTLTGLKILTIKVIAKSTTYPIGSSLNLFALLA